MKKLIIWAVLLCLLLTACTQAVPPEQLNHSTVSTTVPITPASTTTSPTTVPTTVPTTAPSTVPTNNQNKPPVAFSIRDKEKLTLMRKAVTDDEALQQFLKEDSSPLMKNREDVSAFLKLLDSLPNLTIKDAVSFVINYIPEKSYIDIWYIMGEDQVNSRRYLFTYVLDENRAQEIRQSILKEYADCSEKGQLINDNSAISVLAKIKAKAETELTKRSVGYWLDVDGWLVNVHYTHNQTITEKVTLEDAFESMKLEESFQCS